MSLLSYLPFSDTTVDGSLPSAKEAGSPVPPAPIKARAIKPSNVLSFFFSSSSKYKDRASFEDPPYDFVRIAKAIDTDSYAKQAFAKYKDLMWKEGWTITGQNPEAVDYIWRRIDLIEQVMNRPFQDIITEILDQLVKYSNVFIGVARTDLSKLVPEATGLNDSERQKMLAGLYIIPTETVKIKRDKFNRPEQYGQTINSNTMGESPKNGEDIIKWKAEDVIHLHLDRKPGRAFGTPFILPVLNDIVSLRQLEEDMLNLAHRELFPLYLYQVGTDQMPAVEGEIDQALSSIEALKAEGGLVMPGHHDVKVIGAEGSSLDIKDYLAHFKERVAIGLGVSPHHLGMMGTSSNRSVTERLDLALYDKIKHYQAYFEDAVRVHIINKLLVEGGFDPSGSVNNKDEDSDACYFDFNEIDIDTQIKKQNHIVDLFNKNAITFEEMREQLKVMGQPASDNIAMIMMAKVQAQYAPQPEASQPSGSRPDAQKPAPKGQVNLPNIKKDTGTKNRPVNQYKRLQSPNVKNQLEVTGNFAEMVIDFLEEDKKDEF
jgi:hypothetical protein